MKHLNGFLQHCGIGLFCSVKYSSVLKRPESFLCCSRLKWYRVPNVRFLSSDKSGQRKNCNFWTAWLWAFQFHPKKKKWGKRIFFSVTPTGLNRWTDLDEWWVKHSSVLGFRLLQAFHVFLSHLQVKPLDRETKQQKDRSEHLFSAHISFFRKKQVLQSQYSKL